MKDIDDLIKQIQDAANQAAEKARKETLERLMSALTGDKPAPVKKASKPRTPKVRAPKVTTESNGTSGPHLDVMAVQRAVEELPGRGANAIGKELGVEGSVVSALLKKLVKSGTVKTEGKARGTTYYPASL